VDSLLGHFEDCACIAADFPQQWFESDRPRVEPFLENFTTLFLVRVHVFGKKIYQGLKKNMYVVQKSEKRLMIVTTTNM